MTPWLSAFFSPKCAWLPSSRNPIFIIFQSIKQNQTSCWYRCFGGFLIISTCIMYYVKPIHIVFDPWIFVVKSPKIFGSRATSPNLPPAQNGHGRSSTRRLGFGAPWHSKRCGWKGGIMWVEISVFTGMFLPFPVMGGTKKTFYKTMFYTFDEVFFGHKVTQVEIHGDFVRFLGWNKDGIPPIL